MCSHHLLARNHDFGILRQRHRHRLIDIIGRRRRSQILSACRNAGASHNKRQNACGHDPSYLLGQTSFFNKIPPLRRLLARVSTLWGL
ncbi:MAG: hypothetical protein DMF19_10580 [Verrucomicrobia bacterium]|nr:MAG: hypothetical protein DMF19_10580 [Verrucomicrobiota bacterium]